jgi:hypothetical protein
MRGGKYLRSSAVPAVMMMTAVPASVVVVPVVLLAIIDSFQILSGTFQRHPASFESSTIWYLRHIHDTPLASLCPAGER